MSASNAVITPSNIILSPQRVTFNGVDLGATEGGVTVTPKYKIADIHTDQSGSTRVDGAVAGQEYTVKFTLAEAAAAANWKVALPHSKLVGTGATMLSDLQIGDRLSSHAFPLILHPLSKVDGDLSEDIKAFLAVSMSATEIKFGPDKQSGLMVEMTILPDTTVLPWRFFLFGDPSVGFVNASAAAPVAGANTGNGTITGVGVSNQFTKTETVTVACVGVDGSGDNVVTVRGSVSGIMGEFILNKTAASFVNFATPNGSVSFTMTQGSTQFVTGDTFTIALTGANYA